jgi:hypothetical protein|tara:strand:- start:95 stop:541 length:447 start_codon:yes stop_codon:yes gene_type:complete
MFASNKVKKMIYCYKPNAQDYTVENIPTGGVCTDQRLIEDYDSYSREPKDVRRRNLASKQIFQWGQINNIDSTIESAKEDLKNSLEDLRAVDSHGWTNRFWAACSKAIIEHLTEMTKNIIDLTDVRQVAKDFNQKDLRVCVIDVSKSK